MYMVNSPTNNKFGAFIRNKRFIRFEKLSFNAFIRGNKRHVLNTHTSYLSLEEVCHKISKFGRMIYIVTHLFHLYPQLVSRTGGNSTFFLKALDSFCYLFP